MQVILAHPEGLSIQTKLKETIIISVCQEERPVTAEADADRELGTEGSDHKPGPHSNHGRRQLCSPSLCLKTSEQQRAATQRDGVCKSCGCVKTTPQHGCALAVGACEREAGASPCPALRAG